MIQDLIDQKLSEEQAGRANRERSGLWNPSSLGRCFRYQYWNRKNEPQTNPPDRLALRRFKAGKLFHDFVQSFLPPHQVEVLAQKDDIKGFADIVTEDTVTDIKSVHSQQFWYTKKKDYDINKEKFTNILQVTTYAWILGKPKASLVFISKDDLCIDEYVFFTNKWVGEIELELSILREFWEKQELPEPEPRAYGKKEKKFCPYQDKCGDKCGHK